MLDSQFSYYLLFSSPIKFLCFFALAMSFISLWLKKTPWVFGSFLFISYVLALQTKIATPITLIPIGLLFLLQLSLKYTENQRIRFLLFCTATLISFALAFHLLPGFYNWHLIHNMHISQDATAYNLWLNFDKPWIGIFVLSLTTPLLSSKDQLIKMLKIAIPTSCIGIILMIFCSYSLGLVKWDLKIPTIFFIWVFQNLLFVAIPEEAFFRGFIQKEFSKWFGQTSKGDCASVLASSILFLLLHLVWVRDFAFLGLIFVASLIYGTIYQVTQSIEASIICHFSLNLTHFLLFTYPMLQS